MFNVRIPPNVPNEMPFPVEVTEQNMQWITVGLSLLGAGGQPIGAVFRNQDGEPITTVDLGPFGRVLVTCTEWSAEPGTTITVVAYNTDQSAYASDTAMVL